MPVCVCFVKPSAKELCHEVKFGVAEAGGDFLESRHTQLKVHSKAHV